MQVYKNSRYSTLHLLLAYFSGGLIPLVFAIIDLRELGLEISLSNILETFTSQKIYIFSLMFFPAISALVYFMIKRLSWALKHLEKNKSFTTSIMNSLEEYIYTVSKDEELVPQNRTESEETKEVTALLYNHEQFLNLIKFRCNHLEIEHDDKIFLASFTPTSDSKYYTGIVTLKNITSLKRQQEVIEKKGKEVEVSSRLSALGEIASGIAHEINNPLAIIQGNISILLATYKKTGEIPEDKIDCCEAKIETNVERIANIIRHLRNLANPKIESQKNSVATLMENVKPLICSIASSKDVPIEIELNVHENTLVSFSTVELTQIMYNLVSNSLDAIYNSKERWIKVIVDETENDVSFKVVDSGSGIDPTLAERIFTPLFTTKDFGKGSGLGLSLSGMLAKKNNACIYYDKYAKNTTFIVKAEKRMPDVKKLAA